jgi:hypothetical protein
MIKHVGKHNNKRCVILFRTVPGEDHMCLVIYPETMPRHIHDDIMKALESDSGQQAKEFSDYLFRYTLVDGTNALHTLHTEGMIKKVPTNQVIVTPDMKSNVRLDELNQILNKMAMGEEAIKEMAALDSNSGMVTKKRNNVQTERDLGDIRAPRESRSQPAIVENNISINDVLSDEQLAMQRIAQAKKMQDDARALLAEADRLQKEAATLTGATNTNGSTKSKKTAKVQKT